MSAQQLAIVDLAGKQKILLDSIDTCLFTQPSLVNSRKRSIIPIVLQRQALADSLVRYLAQLGLERRHKVNKWYLQIRLSRAEAREGAAQASRLSRVSAAVRSNVTFEAYAIQYDVDSL